MWYLLALMSLSCKNWMFKVLMHCFTLCVDVSVRLRQVREMQHGQEWTKMWLQEDKESAIMSHSNLHRWVRLKTHHNNHIKHNTVPVCRYLRILPSAAGSSTRSCWAPGGVCVKGDPAAANSLHGSLVRPVPQGEDPRDPRVTHGYTQPLTEEGAAASWNPILLAHGPGHPHQLSCGW